MEARSSLVGFAGLGTTVALVFALLGALGTDRPREAPPPARPPADKAPLPAPSSAADTNGTGRALLTQFLGETSQPVPDSLRYQLGILTITVPDPDDSHLDWGYDAQVNAMRRALERSGYVLDRFWLPWSDGPDAAARDSLRTTRPGVMLFRRSDPARRQLRLLYLVGEVPTSGIHKAALKRAFSEGDSLLAWTSHIARDTTAGPELRVVGPVFSGAALSLRMAIDQWRAAHDTARVVRIISGSATSADNRTTLGGPRMTFQATRHSERTLSAFQSEILGKRLHIAPWETAMLQETSTQYGQRARDTASVGTSTSIMRLDSMPIVIPFPMHISELRTEYARNPDQLITGQPLPGTGRNVRLPVRLEDRPSVADGPSVLSPLTPPAVDAMLDDIARTLNAHRIRAVGIRATDIRDVIFLGTEIRKRVRDVVLFTYTSNALFARPDVSQWLRGMLVVSTYPVAVESQFWDVTQRDRQRVSFTGDMAAGMYNAVLLQLGDSAEAAMVDYASPLAEGRLHRPPVWVTTVGRSSMLPVAVLRAAGDGDSSSMRPAITVDTGYVAARIASVAAPMIDKRALVQGQEGRVPTRDILVFVLLAGAGFAWMLRDQLGTTAQERAGRAGARRWMSRGEIRRRLETDLEGFRTAVAVTPWERDFDTLNRLAQWASFLGQREMYTILRVVALSQVLLAMLLLLLRARSHTSGVVASSLWGIGIAVVAGGWVIYASVLRLYTIWGASRNVSLAYLERKPWPNALSCWMWRGEVLGRLLTFGVGLFCLAMSGLLMWNVISLDPVAARGFFYRSTAITAGVTPAIPLLLGGMLFYFWCVWNTQRIARLRRTTTFEQLYFDSGPDGGGFANTATSPARPDRRSDEPPGVPDPGYSPIAPGSGKEVALVGAVADDGSGGGQRRSSGSMLAVADAPAVAADPEPLLNLAPIRSNVRQVRVRLSLSVPGAEGVAIFATLGCLAYWSWVQFNPTMEGIVLPVYGTLTSFDLLLRTCILCAIAATCFGVYRLVGVWLALDGALKGIAETPLVHAFRKLPQPVPRLTRLSPVDEPSDALIDAALHKKWNALRHIYFHGGMGEDMVRVPEVERLIQRLRAGSPPPPLRHDSILPAAAGTRSEAASAELTDYYETLEAAWRAWPEMERIDQETWARGRTDEHRGADAKPPLVEGDELARAPRARDAWLLTAGQCGAIYVVEYVEWVLHHLRNLAAFLMASIIGVTMLIASYPFQPQSALKALFFGVSLATVVALVVVLMQMNRNEVLSRVTDGDAGRVNWDAPFIINLGLYIVLPLFTLLSTEYPAVREFLFSWVNPLLRALGKV